MTGERDPRVKLTTVREYRSAEGKTYFRAWLGDAVLLIFRDDEATPEYGAVATWNAYLVPKKPKAEAGAVQPAARPAERRPSSGRSFARPASRAVRRAPDPDAGKTFDDEIPF